MFEQSLLLDHAAGKKTGALAASLTAQTLFVGVLIAIPLIYSDRLPDVRLSIPLSLPLPPPPAAPQRTQTAVSSSSSRNNSVTTKVYIPRHIVALSQIPDVGLVEAPPIFSTGADIGVPGGTGVPLVNPFFREPITQPKPLAAAPPTPVKPQVVGGDVQAAKLVKKVIPLYPPLARQARVSGTVELIGVIAKDGTIQQLQVTSGHPLLVKAALDAVRQWIYRPTLLNGQAVEVIAPISVYFTISQP
jgi:periplasmic protein TonB